jgi:serine protease Do
VPGIDDGAVQLGHADALKIGQPVTALGYSGGIGMQNSRGDIVALHRLDGGKVIQSTNWFNSGASGGGLFDDELRLVGILTFRLRGGGAHYFAAPVEWIDALLADGRPLRAIGPFGAQERAFWQRPIQAQPDFLQAAVLERDRDWPGLEALTSAWSRAAPGDAEPWYLQGLALVQLDRPSAAREALERSVQLEPALAPAWLRLGIVYLRLGQKERARTVLARLESMSAEFAGQLARLIEPG